MPRSGQLKPQKKFLLELISEMLTTKSDQTYRDIFYKLRSDPEWTNQWKDAGFELPEIGTIKNYVSEVRGLLKTSGSDRSWDILGTADPSDIDFIPSSDLPLVLAIWRRTLMWNTPLTRRQGRWISRLRHVMPVAEEHESDPGWQFDLYRQALKYSAREITLAKSKDSSHMESTSSSIDLDARMAFDLVTDVDEPLNEMALEALVRLGRLPTDRPQGQSIVPTKASIPAIRVIEETGFDFNSWWAGREQFDHDQILVVMEHIITTRIWSQSTDVERREIVDRTLNIRSRSDWAELRRELNLDLLALFDHYQNSHTTIDESTEERRSDQNES